jgi:hypothetical protein
MKKLTLITALVLATSPVAAQVVTGTTTGTSIKTTSGPTTGVFCTEEMTATFCNVPTGPNTSGYGSSGVFGSSGASGSSGVASSFTSSTPPCPEFLSVNDLCT